MIELLSLLIISLHIGVCFSGGITGQLLYARLKLWIRYLSPPNSNQLREFSGVLHCTFRIGTGDCPGDTEGPCKSLIHKKP
ncbi:hypothetical protein BKA56DRAFT_579620 [Ilyonectria sp. MPI-CAGE-AT-0026]|nr:hypothetical protein BKA56DRAFT_579620 [Ilyonectria sp. MPI-CAGE-AT-0026]